MTASPPLIQGPIQAQRRLHRSRTDRVLAGVCGGIAEHLGDDPMLLRIATVVLAIVTGVLPMIVVYIFAAALIPEDGQVGVAPVVPASGGGRGALILGSMFLFIGAIALIDQLWVIDWSLFGPLLLMAIGAAFLVSVMGRGGTTR